ncbi:hypothetical protein A2334_04630 [Candidatus Roizmanbacteria bacterium RIFOXYB2_FULL_38_10]|uniref:Uncharacterized protein n=1 Tax=Candidatus Roizmanbacteria bacterium RIFOXYD1_FULL_38_12 TaxID=1802093 RepID=A0A1F7KZK2_9BACT|nr:MAG: hypothetical protein A3K47_00735 [Candidatus Roizmanbacteria bacterium RIFOXYA2_FULL_38_14]OGK63314.1 MAG: hypothetical protein A3K27_00735 [Candidatus Roizmanbacteria bacterium RIFOXYA1_FULL_37_12]OGK65160.1 MAG: hypothetical protein A3K38_00735 [Candidatus Roizmanbacteria bacterium RIFOXYB1_FULL_40_23]OGK68715.1 MAG: hypothetical protein A2334_04630 [Candidatus Roizmanbacteria bacterium RIFOXYB2_FULL_38_10]OGK69564.1 MAG: hypothetical protein A3K21_00735 [Candidatus Roizmanbacteria ba
MNTTQSESINSISLTKLTAKSIAVTENYKWDSSFIKKFVSKKWPYELYKGSLLNDLFNVLFSPVG